MMKRERIEFGGFTGRCACELLRAWRQALPNCITYFLLAASLVPYGICAAADLSLILIDLYSGQRIPGAEVTLLVGQERWESHTDSNGEAVLSVRNADRFRLRINKSGYVDPEDPENVGRLYSAAGGRLTGGLVRSVVITGRLSDAQGRPLSGAVVMALKRYKGEVLPAGHPDVTDDRGQYRLFGLPPGSYAIAAVPQGDWDSRLPGPVYSPGTADSARATWLHVRPGETVGSIDFTATVESPTSVSGAVEGIPEDWEGIRPVVMLTRQPGLTIPIATMFADSGGKFHLADVPPGEYQVLAWGPSDPSDRSGPVAQSNSRYAMERISVRSGESLDVRLLLGPLVQLKGEFVVPQGLSCTGQESVTIRARGGWPHSWRPEVQARSDGFVIPGIPPGTYAFEIPDLDPSCAVTAVRVGGKTMPPHEAFLGGDSTVSIILAATGEVWGKAIAQGQSAAGAMVALFTDGDDPRPYRVTLADEQGVYRFAQLPPGRYGLHLMGDHAAPQLRIVLAAGERRRSDLTIGEQ